MDNNQNTYDVGYKKPPKEHQFKKGKSGNPNGRKPNSKDFREALTKELFRQIKITENGKTCKITLYEALAKKVVNDCLKSNYLKGSLKDLIYLLDMADYRIYYNTHYKPDEPKETPEERRRREQYKALLLQEMDRLAAEEELKETLDKIENNEEDEDFY